MQEKQDSIITGGFRTHFFKWLENENIAPYPAMFESIPKIVQHAYIIDFLDTIDIKIVIAYHHNSERELKLNYNVYSKRGNGFGWGYDNRNEATEKAIESAINTFNIWNKNGTIQ